MAIMFFMLCYPVLICAKYQVFGEVMSLGINKCLGLKKKLYRQPHGI